MFLVLDVEVVKNLPLLGLCHVGVGVLMIKFTFPHLNLTVLLLHQADEVLILVHKMSVLGQQQLDLLLQVVNLLPLADLEQQLLVHAHQLGLELTHALTPVLRTVVRVVGRSVAAWGVLVCTGT